MLDSFCERQKVFIQVTQGQVYEKTIIKNQLINEILDFQLRALHILSFCLKI